LASMFVRLRVADFEKWKAAFDEFEPARRQATVTGHSVHRDADDPSVVIVAFRVQDLARARQFAASQDLRDAMQRAGVQGQPEFRFAEDVEDKTY
jgi:class 3 adenylate cyclase